MAIGHIKAPIFSTKRGGVLCFRGVSILQDSLQTNQTKITRGKRKLNPFIDPFTKCLTEWKT